MESTPAARLPAVFIIRIWFERGSADDSRRGYVQHVASGSRRYFREIAEAADFIAVLSAPQPQESADSREDDDA